MGIGQLQCSEPSESPAVTAGMTPRRTVGHSLVWGDRGTKNEGDHSGRLGIAGYFGGLESNHE